MNVSPKTRVKNLPIDLSTLLVGALSCYGLFLAGRPFLPKHVIWFLRDLNSARGVGVGALILTILLLLPAALRLRRERFTTTLVTAYCFVFSALFSLELLASSLLGLENLAAWLVRIAYLVVAIWGLWDLRTARMPPSSLFTPLQNDLKHRAWKIGGGLMLFLFVHQCLQEFSKHTTPYGDEIYFWFTASKNYLESNLLDMIRLHNYTPGIPWLATLPARLLDSKQEAWIYPYPILVMTGFVCLLRELSTSWKAWLAGLSALLAVMMTSRDLRFLYFGSVYGESVAALLLAIALIESLRFTQQAPQGWRPTLGLGGFLGFVAIAKPPIANLAPLIGLALVAHLLRKRGPKELPRAALLLGTSVLPLQLWKHALSSIGSKPLYSYWLTKLQEMSFDIAPVKAILHPFIFWSWNPDPSMAMNLGVVLTIFFYSISRQRELKLGLTLSYLIYFAFILGLYATVWQKVETNSAGRYLSQVVLAGVLLIPQTLSQNSLKT